MAQHLHAVCPRCGSNITIMDAISTNLSIGTITYYGECDCGAASITFTQGSITRIAPCQPIQAIEYFDEPTGSQEDPDYMAL